MSNLSELMQQYVDKHDLHTLEGVTETAVPQISFYRSSTGNDRQPFTYQSGILILGQGKKDIHIGDSCVSYGPNDYLVVGMPLPLECEAFAEVNQPLMGLSINIEQATLHRIVQTLSDTGYVPNTQSSIDALCLDSVPMDCSMLDTCIRLMQSLCDETESKVLSPLIYEELVYRVLTSQKGHVLFDLAKIEGQYARIARALNKVHSSYQEVLTVQDLASEANMSVSAFHQAFRAVTLESPLQYIKKVRLNKAKELIHLEGKRVGDAARLVGYNSSSQFSREYKRHFEQTPASAR
ncbi:AraC family transcriptional regulator N-terminal domain-containing protein [Vibrio sp. S4M6]|uniref:AraC family transcriptional regulator n=1 Tax=Vibrio sinus TaxID=2946865 RepID=UPI002029DED7|nr:AraC family transcriptional regulator N-terminal domain-containing protein [Vibrio sinus]MCL9779855.1 AraC family transcriptional regulator N-terminal domain-containing protein [Vibrio sinus]